jgi:hypothetical protein
MLESQDKKVTVTESPFTKGEELCNRTACQTDRRVSYYNKTMQAWYCVKCARLINSSSVNDPLCIMDEDRDFYEKNIKHKQKLTWAEYNKGKEVFEF